MGEEVKRRSLNEAENAGHAAGDNRSKRTAPVRTIKRINIDATKCSGCLACEVICSAFHAEPKYSLTNSARSRIRVYRDEWNDLFVPIFAGPYAEVECIGRNFVTVKGKEYGDCSFCRASCPARALFREPDTGLPLQCDMCGEPLPENGPLCVQWCLDKALTYVETQEEDTLSTQASAPAEEEPAEVEDFEDT